MGWSSILSLIAVDEKNFMHIKDIKELRKAWDINIIVDIYSCCSMSQFQFLKYKKG